MDKHASSFPSDSVSMGLEDRSSLLESLLDLVPSIVYVYDVVERKNVFSNQGIQRILGYRFEDIQEMGDQLIARLMHPVDLTRYLAEILPRYAKAVDGERIVNRYRMKNKDGIWQWIESTESIYERDADGTPRQIIGVGLDITDRMTAEESLVESENRFRALFEKGPIGVAFHEMVYDETGKAIDYRFLDANECYQKLTGVDPRGKLVTQAFPGIEKDPFDWIGTFGKVARTGVEIRFEQYLETNQRWYDCVGYQYKPDHFVAAFIEITERKQAERELRETEATLRESEFFFKESQRASHTGSYKQDLSTGVWTFSEVLGQIFGIEKDYKSDIQGWLDLIDPRDQEMMGRHYSGLIASRAKLFNKEYRIVRASDKESRWVHGMGELSYTPEGVPIAMIGTIRDITEHHEAEAALRMSEERLQLATKSAVIGVWDWNVLENDLYWDDSMYALYGIRREDFSGAYDAWTRILHPDDRDYADGEIQASLRGEREYGAEFRVIHPDGAIRTIKAASRAYRDMSGNVVRIIGVNIDITERKLAEQELERHRNHLEELVAERTRQLEAANAELETFSYTVSHDLRAPLRHIDGFVELLQNECRPTLTGDGLHYLETIASSAQRMGALIDDLLRFSRTSRQELFKQKLGMGALLQEALRDIDGVCSDRNIEWKISDLPEVVGDRGLLRQVWANLLGNAVKYSAKNPHAQVEIGCEDLGDEFRFSIKDNGVGFDMKYASKLFGVFQRLHSPEEFEGTGIGLATIHRILARHGGRIWAQSVPHQETTFFFTLPKAVEGNNE